MKPKPVSKHVVCSVCGLDWDRHPKKKDKEPTLEACVELLKAELASRPRLQQWVSHPTYSGTANAAITSYSQQALLRQQLGVRGISLDPETQVGKIEKAH
jgi:hypothetical protein